MDTNSNQAKRKKYSVSTTNPGPSRQKNRRAGTLKRTPELLCPLLAKDSEWVDILQTEASETSLPANSAATMIPEDEEILQLVECEDEPRMKPLALMFPGLLDKDPQTVQGVLTRAMSTSEVTRHLVGQKANFTCMKKADRLIPPDKQWMETLTENSNSYSSVNSDLLSNCFSNDYDADSEVTAEFPEKKVKQKNISASRPEFTFRNIHENI